MTTDQIRDRLLKCHEQEDEFNKNIGKLDKEIRVIQRKKLKLAKQISKNMLYRNKLIKML